MSNNIEALINKTANLDKQRGRKNQEINNAYGQLNAVEAEIKKLEANTKAAQNKLAANKQTVAKANTNLKAATDAKVAAEANKAAKNKASQDAIAALTAALNSQKTSEGELKALQNNAAKKLQALNSAKKALNVATSNKNAANAAASEKNAATKALVENAKAKQALSNQAKVNLNAVIATLPKFEENLSKMTEAKTIANNVVKQNEEAIAKLTGENKTAVNGKKQSLLDSIKALENNLASIEQAYQNSKAATKAAKDKKKADRQKKRNGGGGNNKPPA